MKFEVAVAALSQGEKVRKVEWNKKEYIVKLNDKICDENDNAYDLPFNCFEDEWEHYEEKEEEEKALCFDHVMVGLKDSKRFKRSVWKDIHIKRLFNSIILESSTEHAACLWNPTIADLDAVDWYEVK